MRPTLRPSERIATLALSLCLIVGASSAFAIDMTGVIVSSSPVAVGSPSPSPAETVLRTPAQQYGSAYSIKVKLVRGDFDWVVPVWIKPDEKHSSFDVSLMRLMGWAEPKFDFDEVTIAGYPLSQTHFIQAKSDWAYYPNFAKSCCAGILGADVLDQFEIRFDPKNPKHLEWRKLSDDEKPKRGKKLSNAELQALFSLRNTKHKKGLLTETPYVLNLRDNELVFENQKESPKKSGSR